MLGTLQRNQGILSDVEARATQVAPYLRNLLALSTALQQKYSAAPLAADTSVRVLLVSDIHGGNQYSLMRAIVEEEGIDLVVDAGDLVNFGTVEEGEAAGIFAGIESVGVPYLFVRGNHDATSATDTSVLDRMSRMPNVVLLQPPTGGYTEVQRGGRADRRLQRPAVVRRLRRRLTGQAGAGPRGLRRRVHAGARRRTSSWATSRGRCRAWTPECSSTGTCTRSTSRATGCRPGPSPAAARSATSSRTRPVRSSSASRRRSTC